MLALAPLPCEYVKLCVLPPLALSTPVLSKNGIGGRKPPAPVLRMLPPGAIVLVLVTLADRLPDRFRLPSPTSLSPASRMVDWETCRVMDWQPRVRGSRRPPRGPMAQPTRIMETMLHSQTEAKTGVLTRTFKTGKRSG